MRSLIIAAAGIANAVNGEMQYEPTWSVKRTQEAGDISEETECWGSGYAWDYFVGCVTWEEYFELAIASA